MTWTEYPFTTDDQEDVTHYAAEGLRLLESVDQSAEPITIVRAIGAHVDQQRRTVAQADEEAYALFILAMGYLWGQQVCREYAWEWERVGETEVDAGHVVVSPTRAYMVSPLHFIKQFIDNAEQPTTVILLFNMLAPDVLAKQAPSQPHAFVSLG